MIWIDSNWLPLFSSVRKKDYENLQKELRKYYEWFHNPCMQEMKNAEMLHEAARRLKFILQISAYTMG